ncbi:protein cramped-like isoform X1 [Biomphalaria glabrata]|uniref:Protein cramped-like isoform X1 n=1 Tax=Biomphalaria glabrata TaxID=6526 RepID=A0A9W3B370_BIOGL|nr:protein cramped-like isoform X1 [Biomphalaria glabrata]KAI8799101.1 protein cramped isoform X2 [Biomphalaria glabrata]
MAPKRRKLSLEDGDASIQDVKRSENTSLRTVVKQSSNSVEEQKPANANDKTYLAKVESSSDLKAKEECPKPLRISERLSIKRNRIGDLEEIEGHLQAKSQTTPKKQNAAKQPTKKDSKKKPVTAKLQRSWNKQRSQWGVQDKKYFFIGLGEYGKNFEAICNRISHAARLCGFPVKDKMQVRYFYYRTWAKISKFVNMKDSGVKMKTQELYGLINYGVLRNYVKENDPQFERCLNELIFLGETKFISRGKKQKFGKVRTPICTCLKKLNRIEASTSSTTNKLPSHITLELTPKNSKSWAKVQALSQNPRVRLKVTCNRTLESVFKYFEKKWKPLKLRLKEGLGGSEAQNEELVFFLHPSCKLKPVTLIPQEQPRIDVTFRNYREKILPQLLIKKKQRSSKESERLPEEKDKLPDNIPIDPGGSVKAEQQSSKSNSDPAFDTSKVKNEPPAFSCLLSLATAPNNPTITHSVSQSSLSDTHSSTPTPSAVLMEDENAMFPDDAPFSPPPVPLPHVLSSPVIMSSPPPASVISPTTQLKKKSGKTSKKHLPFDDHPPLPSICDNPIGSDNSSSPVKNEGASSVSAQELKEESEKEIVRLKTLVAEGFTLKNSNSVILLHLSILLGRESVIKMEYEWKEKNPSKLHLPPLLCQATNQMSNVLRRLCNIATLELSDYNTTTDQSKPISKSVPCSHCGWDTSCKSRLGRRQVATERKERMQDIATMTDPVVSTMNHIQTYQALPGIVAGARTYVAAPPSGSIQIIGPDPVFRVPFVPTYKPVLTKEQQKQLEEQQRTAKEIMLQGPNPRRLLKKRTMSRKTTSSVQRALVPKIDPGGMSPYLQQLPKSVVVRMGPEEMVKSAQAVNIICSSAPPKEPVTELPKDVTESQEVLLLSTLPAPDKPLDCSSVCSISISDQNLTRTSSPILPMYTLTVATTSANLSGTSSPKTLAPPLTSQGDVSISDFGDISLSSVSDLGPDAGDKFLELVLPKSVQGFSGLLCTPTKLKSDSDVPDMSFATPVLRTPTHTGISLASFLQTPILFPSPLKLDASNQQWITSESGEISLSAILGESSSFKTQSDPVAITSSSETKSTPSSLSYAFFEDSSDASFSTSLMLNKHSEVNDISLSSLLGDPSFKKEDSQQRTSPTLASGPLKSINLFSGALDVESSSQLFGEASQDSLVKLDVDGFVNDGSLDFVSKFESMAAQIAEKHHQGTNITDKPDKLLINVEHGMET